MTPKEKARELYNTYEQLGRDFTRGVSMNEFAKHCALIAVDEILEMDLPILEEDADKFYDYWQEVKQEIEQL